MKTMACTAALSAPSPAQGDHHWPTPPLATLGHSWGSLGQSLVGSQCLSPRSWCTQGFVCAIQEAQDLEKAEEPEIKLILWIIKKAREFQKTSTSALLTMPKPLTVWITINCGKFWKRWEYQTTLPASWEMCMQVRKQQLELDMEQQTGSK